jgi:AraC family transcriptional activator of tynA and feaB
MVPIKAIAEMPMHGKLEHFHALVGDTFFPLSCESRSDNEGPFSGGVVSHQFGELGFAAVKTSPLDVYRRRSHISQVSDAVYLIKVQVEGDGLVQQLGREAHLRPGDFALCLSSEPYELHFEKDSTQVVLSVPQPILEECVRQPSQHLGVRMEFEVGANGLFSQFVTSIASRLGSLDGVLAQRLEANVIDLLSTTLGHTRETERRDLLICGVKQDYLRRIRYFVRQNLHEEKLTPHWIAETHQISTRYLHMLFEEEGVSISRYIQKMRLEACRSALVDPSFLKYSVADIAYRCSIPPGLKYMP